MRILACGAHADDVEIGCGGTIALCASQGHEVAILDLTAGELGSNGTPAMRVEEAARAARVLGVTERFNAGLPDGLLREGDPEQRKTVIEWIRRLRPELVLVTPLASRHPDHVQAARLVTEAAYLAGLKRYPAEGEAFRPRLLLQYMDLCRCDPTFVVPTSEFLETKRGALLCYKSQFKRADGTAPTRINSPDFLEQILARDRFYGGLAGVPCGEPLLSCEIPVLSNLEALLDNIEGDSNG
ncbi:MAG: bacillithiol biosynthesis deacetylase BshB1 [bacterium]|nr:bacillithiol biosynthesis deacetylase BshB1 [bacterium]